MTPSITVSDFKPTLAVCEIRYENAYLIYDRTGLICADLRKLFTDLRVVSPSPNQTILQAEEGSFGLELNLCRFTTQKPDSQLEAFAEHGKRFFDSVLYNLDIKAFTRIGLRVMLRRDFKDLDSAQAALTSLNLVNIPPGERFQASAEPREVSIRWEGKQIGTNLRLKAGGATIDVILPPELEAKQPEIHKSIFGLELDLDYYTVAPVERSQWDASSWITHSLRTMKKGADSILGN